jgi:hypothetical protein
VTATTKAHKSILTTLAHREQDRARASACRFVVDSDEKNLTIPDHDD